MIPLQRFRWMNGVWLKAFKLIGSFYLCTVATMIFADGIIPISSNDETASGSDFANTFLKIFKNDLMPILEYGGAVILVFYAVVGIWKGFRESQERNESEPFKNAIVRSVILVVCGGALIYILQQIGDRIPTS